MVHSWQNGAGQGLVWLVWPQHTCLEHGSSSACLAPGGCRQTRTHATPLLLFKLKGWRRC